MSGAIEAPVCVSVPNKVDRTLNMSIIFAIFVQTAGALLWAGAAAARLQSLESHAEEARDVNERLARIETQITMTRESMDRIEGRLDRLPHDGGLQ